MRLIPNKEGETSLSRHIVQRIIGLNKLNGSEGCAVTFDRERGTINFDMEGQNCDILMTLAPSHLNEPEDWGVVRFFDPSDDDVDATRCWVLREQGVSVVPVGGDSANLDPAWYRALPTDPLHDNNHGVVSQDHWHRDNMTTSMEALQDLWTCSPIDLDAILLGDKNPPIGGDLSKCGEMAMVMWMIGRMPLSVYVDWRD